MERPSVDDYFGDWKQREALVQEMIPVIGRLLVREMSEYLSMVDPYITDL